jgi:hypothetical protein
MSRGEKRHATGQVEREKGRVPRVSSLECQVSSVRSSRCVMPCADARLLFSGDQPRGGGIRFRRIAQGEAAVTSDENGTAPKGRKGIAQGEALGRVTRTAQPHRGGKK